MMDDLISRQAAINNIKNGFHWETVNGITAQAVLKQVIHDIEIMPSAQPEITMEDVEGYCVKRCLTVITNELFHEMRAKWSQPEIVRCKNCRWWDKYSDYDNGYCMAAKHGYCSEHWEISIRRTYKGDFYCADAERRTDEE